MTPHTRAMSAGQARFDSAEPEDFYGPDPCEGCDCLPLDGDTITDHREKDGPDACPGWRVCSTRKEL